ncbi:hypothetical protein D3C87_1635120 [compost metagenome]
MNGGAVDDGFGGVVEQVTDPQDFVRAPAPMVHLQGVAQVMHSLMDFRRAIMAAQRTFADVDAHPHAIQCNGLLLQE